MSCPHCQGSSKFQDRRDKTFVSLMGQVVLQRRAYYHCPACHAGHVPLDVALGVSACKLTPGGLEARAAELPAADPAVEDAPAAKVEPIPAKEPAAVDEENPLPLQKLPRLPGGKESASRP